MGDPGFIPGAIGFGVSKSIEVLIEVVNGALKCSNRCTELKEKLDKVLPRVRHVEEQIASEKMRYEGPVREWLDCLKAVADEANIAVQKSNSKSFWLLEKAALSTKLKELHARMEKLGEKDLDFSLHFQTHEQLVLIQNSVARIQSHQSPASSSQPYVAPQHHMYGSHSLNYTVQGHQHMYNPVSHSEFSYTGQGCHQPDLHRIESLDDILCTRGEAMQRAEETRRQEKARPRR